MQTSACGPWGSRFEPPAPQTTAIIYLWGALAIGVLGLVVAFLFSRSVLGCDAGTPEMQAISNAIREGAEAFMSRQYGTIAIIAVVLAVLSLSDTGSRPSPPPSPTRSSSAF